MPEVLSNGGESPKTKVAQPSFDFMKKLVDYVTGLTTGQIENSVGKNGQVYFGNIGGQPRLINPKYAKAAIVWLNAKTIQKRSGAFETSGPLEHMESFVRKSDGTLDRKMKIEQVSMGAGKGVFDVPVIKSTEMSVGSILARAKNSFRESDTVERIIQLSVGDLMYIRFVDDSHVYAISVKNSSQMIGNQATALCNITYQGEKGEVTQEGIIRLPLYTGREMFVTTGGKKILALNKKVVNMKVRRRKESTTH